MELPESARIREEIRRKEWTGVTAGLAKGYAQANLVILPKDLAYDFLLFCHRNPKPCPLLEVTDVGSPFPAVTAKNADLRTDLPRYRVYRKGECVDEPYDILSYWQNDLVAFLIGCSFTFEHALLDSGLPIRHIEEGKNAPMYTTSIRCQSAGVFEGNMVVSMRPFKPHEVVRAVQITSRYPAVHGSPVHIGAPTLIGIADLSQPDFGEAVTVRDDEVPVFWACGVTPQAVAMTSKPAFMITHAPGHMFITDQRDQTYSIF